MIGPHNLKRGGEEKRDETCIRSFRNSENLIWQKVLNIFQLWNWGRESWRWQDIHDYLITHHYTEYVNIFRVFSLQQKMLGKFVKRLFLRVSVVFRDVSNDGFFFPHHKSWGFSSWDRWSVLKSKRRFLCHVERMSCVCVCYKKSLGVVKEPKGIRRKSR